MKTKHLWILGLLLGCMACQSPDGTNEEGIDSSIIKNPNSASGDNSEAVPKITFDEIRHEFGTIVEGEKVKHSFGFTNTGDAPLIINNVRAECGCTVINDWPKQAVKPGESSKVSIEFDSKGKVGNQVKRLTITANTNPSSNVVALSGTVTKNKTIEK